MRINKSLITYIPSSGAGSGTVTSVAMSVPTGFAIGGSPITSSGTLALSFASGYSLPTTAKQTQWDTAYTWVAAFPSQTGNASKYLKTDGTNLSWAALEIYATAPLVWTAGTFTMSITQASSGADGYLSSTDWTTFNNKMNNVFTTLGDIVYSNAAGAPVRRAGNTDAVTKFLSQTGDGFGNSAAPQWLEITPTTIGAVPTTRTLTINDVAFDLSANRSWSVGDYGTW